MKKELPYPMRAALLALAIAMICGTAAAQQANPASAKGAQGGGKAKGDESWEIEQRKRWWIESRGLDKVKSAKSSRLRAVRDMSFEKQARASLDIAAGNVWRELGPSSMKMGNWVMGRVSGRINAIAPHPTDDNTVYIGSANGGVWKTTDAGIAWTPLFTSVGSQSIGAIHVESAAAQNVWVGTGDKNDGACAGYLSQGIFLSTDSGASWSAKNGSGTTAMKLSVVSSLHTLPTNSNVILAGGFGDRCNGGGDTNGGIYRSTDRGVTWTQTLDRKIEDIVTIPGSNTLYASAPGAGVYKSTDGGVTWASVSTGLSVAGSRMRLAIAPSNANVLYALNGVNLYRSLDAGASWALRSSTACDSQCTYNLALTVHPTDSATVLVGAIRPRRSTDGGGTFTTLTNTWGSAQQVHQDTHVVRYSRNNPSRFWIGSDGGIWRTDNAASGWVNMNSNLNITQYYDIAVDPTNPNIVFGGAQDNSSSRRVDSNVWDLTFVNGDGFMNAIDETNANIVFQNGYPNGSFPSIYRSTQGGAPGTFASAGSCGLTAGGFPWVTPAAVAGGYHFVGSTRVFRALASGSMCWTDISGVVSGTVRVITPLKVGTAVHTYAGTTAGAIYYSANAAGTNLANVTGNYPGGSVSDIAIDPTNPSRVFVTRSAFGGAKLYRSTTAGGTWTAMGSGLPDIPASTVAIDPLNVSRIFVGTDVGVFESTDGGVNFFAFSTGLPQGLVVSDLEIDNSPHMLTAGTYGRGAWQINLGSTGNAAPVANYNHTINGLTVTFSDTSTDSDGTIAARNWNFGDGTSSTTTNPSKAYGSAGTYQVALTVTDNASATNTLTKAITVTAGSSCSTGTAYSGSFSGANGQTKIQPNGTWYQSTTSGTHSGCLDGPTGTDFDLHLDKWNGSAWVQVSASTSSGPDETISYQGTAGYYQFRVKNYSGTGSYTFTLTRPQ